ncbi:lectin [Streptacidiphilus sp. EB129]|uniref:GH92 family glycosyl hydrolase n=1 Tax=Streptacidiphilus sp. EB129 TaxID=3156262 RepID=UPI003512F1C3
MTRPRRTGAPLFRTVVVALSAAALAVLPLRAVAASPAHPAEPITDAASLVNPIIGTSGSVDTFPGADTPFGMVQWSPDTTPERADGGGYEYNDKNISGYSLTHLSGPGCPSGGDLPILPFTGALGGDLGSTSVGFTHSKEAAQAGYYSLTDNAGVTSQLATTSRAGIGRFTFPSGADAHLLLKLSGGATQIDGTRAQIVGNNEVVGAIDSGHFCGAGSTYTIHFDIKFDQPFSSSGTWVGSTVDANAKALQLGAVQPTQTAPATQAPRHEAHFTVPGKPQPTTHGAKAMATTPPVVGANGVYLGFDTSKGTTVTAKVGISYTSDTNAAQNLATEIHGWNFDAVRQSGHDAWNKVLGRIQIGGGSTDQQVQFYTALYHSLLHPNVFSDDNRQYMGMDQQIHTVAKGHTQYANYSGWDIYRSETQLISLVDPSAASDMVTSMLNGFDQTGIMPKWANNSGESYVMVGDPADSIIADSYAFGARGFNVKQALSDMVYEGTHTNNDRPGEAIREAKGYLPIDDTSWGCCNFYGPVSTQEEYDTADYSIASLAKSLGNRATYSTFASRAQDWQNVFNPQTGYLQAKLADGDFAPGFSPGTSNGFVEGTSAQYTPMIPFNLQALIQSRGGAAAYSSYLDSLLANLTNPGSTNADLSNEPSLEIPWEYDYVGEPWKTQQSIRAVQQELFFNAPTGEFGNDDLGEMSSSYVWGELGMYPETPGTDTLALASPVFPTTLVHLASGRTLTIDAPAAATGNPYVQSLSLNGKSWNQPWVSFGSLAGGGTLDYTLGSTPNTSWGTASSAAPPSDSTGERPVLASVGPSTGGGLILAPGASGTATLDLANISDSPVGVNWTATPPSGVTLTVTSGTLTVPARATMDQKLQITAGSTEGAYSIPITLTAGATSLPSTALKLAVASVGELWPYQTDTGVYADGTTFGGGFDGGGFAYSEQLLAAAGVKTGGTVTSGGITYSWPGGTGKPDNIVVSGQTIPLNAPAGAASIGFLGAGTNSPATGTSGDVVVTYTDGSTAKVTLTFSDWTLNAGASHPLAGETVAASMPARDSSNGSQQTVSTDLFSTKLPLDATKQVASITLPTTDNGTLHIFAIGFGS